MRLPPVRHFHLSYQIHNKSKELDSVLKGLCFSGRLREAVNLVCCSGLQLEPQTYSLLLQECIYRREYMKGKRLHGNMIVLGLTPDEFLQTKLLVLYSKSGDLDTAHSMFDKNSYRNAVSWNALIAGYVQKGEEETGLNLYYKMRSSGLLPDQFTFASVFRACSSLATLEQGKRVHGVMIKSKIGDNVVVNSALMDMYFKCSNLYDARKVFDKASERNVITWSSLIAGYGQHGRVKEVLELFHRMIDEGIKPNYVTFLAVLSACSHGGLVDDGLKYFSSMTREFGIKPRGKHYAAMVDLLGRSGRLNEAYEFVKNAPCKEHSVIWGAFLGACRNHKDLELAKVAAKKFFEMDPENAGKYIVLSNAYAMLGQWKDAKEVREGMRVSGVKKEPGCSWVEIQREVHIFLAGDKFHRKYEQVYEMIKELTSTLKDAGYIPDVRDEEDFVGE
ncbi:pentatricopeptide repeat-containing protein At4g16470 [Papaver somniferum]|uniref:pentatricopeptide repeat-containing protein At4g16470 n=1 Tax=Papaver somniferum TaxID=3469 RepID=UPI000E700857|nr:pentatricopeptide repeat-containing protein At4g16470 [Papaver somniferum]